MATLTVCLGTRDGAKSRVIEAANRALAGDVREAKPMLTFLSYDDLHRTFAPSRFAIVKALAGQGPLTAQEVAKRVGGDAQAVDRDITTLINAGVIDRTDGGVEFPYDRIRFEYEVSGEA